MNENTLKRAKELDSLIKELSVQIQRWEKADRISRIELSNSYTTPYSIDAKYIDFNLLKVVTLAKLYEELRKAQEEFNNL